MLKIEKYYEETVNLGNYESAKIGLTIKSDKEIKTGEELSIQSEKLFLTAKNLVRKEIQKLKEERKNQTEVK